jgi:hypothetical protein
MVAFAREDRRMALTLIGLIAAIACGSVYVHLSVIVYGGNSNRWEANLPITTLPDQQLPFEIQRLKEVTYASLDIEKLESRDIEKQKRISERREEKDKIKREKRRERLRKIEEANKSTAEISSAPCINYQRKDMMKETNNTRQRRVAIDSLLKYQWKDMMKQTNSTGQRRIVNLIRREGTIPRDDVVLATHVSSDRFLMLLTQARSWNGPISVAVYIHSYETIDQFSQFVAEHANQLRNTSIHILLESEEIAEGYPHNILRNLALVNIESDYFFATDADHIPSPDSHNRLYQLISGNAAIKSRLANRTVFVFPAFDVFRRKNQACAAEDMLPQSKDEVLSKVKRGRIGQFHAKACPLCHGPTNYTKWYDYKSDDFYPITDVEGKFEPYVLGSRVGAPLYWEAFRGFGFNKRSWFAEITVAGYKFAVLRDFWVAHLQHRELNLPSKMTAIKQARKTWEEFHGYLTKTYGRSVNY